MAFSAVITNYPHLKLGGSEFVWASLLNKTSKTSMPFNNKINQRHAKSVAAIIKRCITKKRQYKSDIQTNCQKVLMSKRQSTLLYVSMRNAHFL